MPLTMLRNVQNKRICTRETHILREVSPFLFNSFHILRLQKQSFFRIFERYVTLPMVIFRAWATCGVDLPAQVDLTLPWVPEIFSRV